MHLAILGATGAVGRTMLQVLEERGVPVERLTLLASPRSAGQQLPFRGRRWPVEAVHPAAFRTVDVALFSAGAERSRQWAPIAAAAGAIVIDNSSAWRLDPEVPLVVPEVNLHALRHCPKGLIANPNCVTIQLVVALAALRRVGRLRRVDVASYQAASGAGESGRAALRAELQGETPAASPFPRPLAGNVVPHIGPFDADGWTDEERKIQRETQKILEDPDLAVAGTCVRVPVEVGHSVAACATFAAPIDLDAVREALTMQPGLQLAEPADAYPTPRDVAGRDDVVVGRLRRDPFDPCRLHLWIVADNLRKGAATNAVQILEALPAVGLRPARKGSESLPG